MSRAARDWIERYGIPEPSKKGLGEIEVIPFPGPGSLTKEIAWAASVLNDSSSLDVIYSIGQRLGEYANAHPGALIESPLLGTGKGG